MADTAVTWLGHAAFRVETPGGKRVYLDPWLGNPKCLGQLPPARAVALAVFLTEPSTSLQTLSTAIPNTPCPR